MQLKIISTGSKGNAYVLENEHEALLIECGVKIPEIKKALDFNLSKVVGAIVTHEHLDHSKGVSEVMRAGIDVHMTMGTAKGVAEKQSLTPHRSHRIVPMQTFKLGKFKIMAFDVKHDANQPVGFLIEHADCGKVLFLTDTYYCKYTFPGLNNIIVEANYCTEIIKRKYGVENGKAFLRDRIFQSHFSIDNCRSLLGANDLTAVNNIVLIHLSDSNSDEIAFVDAVHTQTRKNVTAAVNGLVIDFKKTPF